MLDPFDENKFCKNCFHDDRLVATNQCDCHHCRWSNKDLAIRFRMPISMETRIEW